MIGGNSMKILHLTEKDYKVGLWSGGSTTELFIWPEGADYSRREFTFRVSSARVDLEESDFTPLMGVTRYITPLTGGFTLTHPDCAPVVMGPLSEPYRFSAVPSYFQPFHSSVGHFDFPYLGESGSLKYFGSVDML